MTLDNFCNICDPIISSMIRHKQSTWTINRIFEVIVFKSYNRQFNSRYRRLVQLRYLMHCKNSLGVRKCNLCSTGVFSTLCTMNVNKLVTQPICRYLRLCQINEQNITRN